MTWEELNRLRLALPRIARFAWANAGASCTACPHPLADHRYLEVHSPSWLTLTTDVSLPCTVRSCACRQFRGEVLARLLTP